ncbi:Nuclease-related domain-containing protein [Alkalibacterium subtropicum]|uniref:Nuclease-related domain-containing protein n=1 Tax=Alkalibacterium subtropicum TaxID=753702 RepID=A0A1I1JVX4_9LACT|nr:nuclease-related domain-containing protein [Alkalibacterium subtropicum]SFC52666.1 Nuclease-related domain-containing protein [Alkalibacterium subtropicum]
MEILKQRDKPELLHYLQLLNKRMILPIDQKRSLYNLEKGFEGERYFDDQVEQYFSGEGLILNDVLLVINGTMIQIDTLIITAEGVRIYEVKNYQGNYDMQAGRLLTMSGQEVLNPLSQISRSLIKFSQLFKELKCDEAVKGSAVFVDPSFFLYHASQSDPIVFSNQIERHFSELSSIATHLNKNHQILAEKLLELHGKNVSYKKELPSCDYSALKKSLFCKECGSTDLKLTQRSCLCRKCQRITTIEESCLHNISELKYLFPEKKVTTASVYEWCGGQLTAKRIRQILKRNFSQKEKTAATHYE